jgi:CDP-diacylglycerol--inositol 3-phosphatidyltransferase
MKRELLANKEMLEGESWFTEQPPPVSENVFLYVPNLIGYSRMLLVLLSFWLMPSSPTMAASCYVLAGLLDAVDGHIARLLGQTSRFGAMLDMLTDRCASMGLLATLCTFYPRAAFIFQPAAGVHVC